MGHEQFLAGEAEQSQRNEFGGGEVFALAGAEDRHETVGGNLYMVRRQHLAGTPCRTFMTDMRVAVASNYFYPDVLVTCIPLPKAKRFSWPAWRWS